MIKRRSVLAGVLGGTFALGISPPLLAQNANLQVTLIEPGIHLIQGAGCNVVLADLADALLVIDGGLAVNAEYLLRQINQLAPGKAVQMLFNTSWRPKHAGLNALVSQSARIIAHENTRLWQTVNTYVEWENLRYPALPEEAQVNEGFYQGGSLQLGSEIVRYERLAKAHSDGDIYVYFQHNDVLYVGEMLAVDSFPQIDYVTGGWIRGLRDATQALLDLAGDNTKIIAADGGVQARSALDRQLIMLDETWSASQEAFRNGMSVEEFQASNPVAAHTEERGDPSLFLYQVYRSTWYHMAERSVPGVI